MSSNINSIERDDEVSFHIQGTLNAVTRWVTSHEEGIAEWLKNSRRMYQVDRADVPEDQRAAAVFFVDAQGNEFARIGVLDVGGVSTSDLERWSVWQDPNASRPSGNTAEEQTQGNGGKAYMYRLFTDVASVTGVVAGRLSRKGFVGLSDSEERGRAGWIPNRAAGYDAASGPLKVALNDALTPYRLSYDDLPPELRNAVKDRAAFTLVEGIAPKNIFQGRIAAKEIVERLVRHEQTTLVLEQMKVYAFHNGQPLLDGDFIKLEEIEPFEGLERPIIVQIPEVLPLGNQNLSTTADGKKPQGRLTLYTSKRNMATAHKRLKPRWKISYRTQTQMIGAKPVSEFVPATPGSYFVYGTVELPSLEPDYVSHGRVRPNDGPLMEALDDFIAEHIRHLARQIADRNRHEYDESELDAVMKENRMLDRWKDQFLPQDVDGGTSGDGRGSRRKGSSGDDSSGLEPFVIDLKIPTTGLRLGAGVTIHLPHLLSPTVRDELGRVVSGVQLVYKCDDPSVVEIDADTGEAIALQSGECVIYAQIESSGLSSDLVSCQVVSVDHILLTPRQIELPIGSRRQIIAEVTTVEGQRFTDVFLTWKHDAEDPLTVRIRPDGIVTGNRLGETRIYAGAGADETDVWARVPATIVVVDSPQKDGRGEGHPQLKVTGRDIDPETGNIREGDSEQPVLWQEPIDVKNNIWWLNLEAPEAGLAFRQRAANAPLWRLLHASKLVEMVCQVRMQNEYFTTDTERLEPWATHKQALERNQVEVSPGMWEQLSKYVISGEEL